MPARHALTVFANRGAAALCDQAIVSITSFATAVVIGRSSGKATLDMYVLGISLLLSLQSLQESLIVAPYTVYSATLNGPRLAEYSGSILVHQAAVASAAVGLVAIASALASRQAVAQPWLSIVPAVIVAIPAVLLRECIRRICFAALQMKAAVVFDASVCCLQAAGLFLLSRRGPLSASSGFRVSGLSCAAAVGVWLVTTRRNIRISVSCLLPDAFTNWSFGKWLVGASVLSVLATQAYPWILSAERGVAAAGTFAACSGMVAIANPLLLGITNFISPKMAHVAEEGVEQLHRLTVGATCAVAVCAAAFYLAIAMCAEPLLTVTYGKHYSGNGPVVSLLALGAFVLAVSTPVGYSLRAMHRPDVTLRSALAQTAITITVGLWLVREYSVIGAAWALFGGACVVGALTGASYLRELRARIGRRCAGTNPRCIDDAVTGVSSQSDAASEGHGECGA